MQASAAAATCVHAQAMMALQPCAGMLPDSLPLLLQTVAGLQISRAFTQHACMPPPTHDLSCYSPAAMSPPAHLPAYHHRRRAQTARPPLAPARCAARQQPCCLHPHAAWRLCRCRHARTALRLQQLLLQATALLPAGQTLPTRRRLQDCGRSWRLTLLRCCCCWL